MGKLLVPLNVRRYNRGVAQTQVVVTEFNRLLEEAKITTWDHHFFARKPQREY